jgi:hypothetical protein
VLHPAPRFQPSWSRFRGNVASVNQYLSTFEPTLLRLRPVVPLMVVVLVALAVTRRQYQRLAALTAVALVYAVILAVPRANDFLDTPYYPAARVLLPLPAALWFAVVASKAGVGKKPFRYQPIVPALVALCCVMTVGFELLRWRQVVGPLTDQALAFPNYPLTESDDLRATCMRVEGLRKAERVVDVVFSRRTPAYACQALVPSMTTVYPPYERRSWAMRSILQRAPKRFLFVDDSESDLVCVPAVAECVAIESGVFLVTGSTGVPFRSVLVQVSGVIRPPF